MYTDYWNLREKPFQNVADTRFAYVTDQLREGLARLLYLVDGKKQGGVVIGPHGVGKSMLFELLAKEMGQREHLRFLRADASPAGALPIARALARKLDLCDPIEDVPQALDAFAESFGNDHTGFSHLVLAVDEAHLLHDPETFVFMHLLTNLRGNRRHGAYGDPAVTLLFSGHRRLARMIAEEASLSQRLSLTWELAPLNEAQTVAYVPFRIRRAGGSAALFDDAALTALHAATQGLPRLINNVCDIALVLGCAERETMVTRRIMDKAIDEVRPLPDLGEDPAS